MHYVTYVRVYSSTPTTVVVGYTPGYYGTVTTVDNVVVYGTGYAYPVYVGTVWYPPPPTYGWRFGFTVGMFWGFAIRAAGTARVARRRRRRVRQPPPHQHQHRQQL